MPYRLLPFLLLVLFSSCTLQRNRISTEAENASIVMKRQALKPGNSLLTGRVVDSENGEPISWARVQLMRKDTLVHTLATDGDGLFSVKDIPPGRYTLRIKAVEYHSLEPGQPFRVEPGSTWKAEVRLKRIPIVVEKPLIYLYPTQAQQIRVRLQYRGKLTHTYPAYPHEGWSVRAQPDGTLHDEEGKEYYGLFWEGIPDQPLQATSGFVVPGTQSAAFLESTLAELGLNRREANEFILYWLPRLEANPYNFIHFAGADYEALAPLHIEPKPETMIRVMMLTKPLQAPIPVTPQDLTSLRKQRKGYTVVEWGGAVIP
jgi:hypothetical protein